MSGPFTLGVRDLDEQGILAEVAKLFNTAEKANGLLGQVGLDRDRRPIFESFSSALGFWRTSCELLEDGALAGGLAKLLIAAEKLFPDNSVLASWRIPQSIAGLVVEVSWGAPLRVSEALSSRRIREIRDETLARIPPPSGPRRVRVLRVHSAGSVPLRLETSLAEAGLRDGDSLRLSHMINEEDGPEDIGPFLTEVLSGFYTARVRQLRADARRSGIDRPAGLGASSRVIVQAVVQAAAELRVLPDLTLLASVRALAEADLLRALGRLVWYGSPAEIAPEVYPYLRRGHRQALDGVWSTL